MKIRRFYSNNVRSALRQVTETFGEDAAILSNKKVEGGVEIIAAIDYDESLMPPTPEYLTHLNTSTNGNLQRPGDEVADPLQSSPVSSSDTVYSGAVTHEKMSGSLGISDVAAPTTGEIVSKQNSGQLDQLKNPAENKPVDRSGLEWSLDPSLQAMKEELGLMRTMMAEQLKGISWNRFTEKDPLRAMIMRRLSNLGLESDLLNSLLPHVEINQDAECSWQKILAMLAKSVSIENNDLLETGGIFALVGPTGVGKTTTIAKLAARFVIKHGSDSVALITTDNYRISAQEQLTTFGRLLKIPTAKVSAKDNLESLLKHYADKKLILIDTAGVSSNDPFLMKQLDGLNNSRRPINTLLLMSAACQAAVLQRSLKLFSLFSPNGLIITKIDEATSLGEILSVVVKAGIPICYTTDGQKIPEDIRIARSHHLVSKAVWLANKYTKETEEWALAQNLEQTKLA